MVIPGAGDSVPKFATFVYPVHVCICLWPVLWLLVCKFDSS